MKKQLVTACAIAMSAAFVFGGCNANGNMMGGEDMGWGSVPDAPAPGEGEPNYHYSEIIEQEFHDTAEEPASYFSLDRNTANYAYVRAQINEGMKVAADSVRIEELVNYFSYGYPAPEDGKELAVTGYLLDCPWNAAHKLAGLGIRTAERVLTATEDNYTFLIDISGSMAARVRGASDMSCLDLVKYGIEKLVAGMGASDRVSIVVYAGSVQTKLEPTLATEEGKKDILRTVKNLQANGSTNGAGGLKKAYEEAQKYYVDGGNNRVILLSDGDFNVGYSSPAQLEEIIRGYAQSGVYLSVIGVGMGNTRDDIMETLALAGNGNYAYLDSPLEAEKVLSEELAGTLYTVAKDVKAGVTFNPATVARYRILGYDMKTMSEDDFNDEEKDAGEIGSNLCVTALYELELTEDAATMSADALLATAEIRYKSVAESEESKSVSATLSLGTVAGDDLRFASCVAEFGLLLRRSAYRGNASFAGVLGRLKELAEYLSGDAYKQEFRALVEKAAVSELYEGEDPAP